MRVSAALGRVLEDVRGLLKHPLGNYDPLMTPISILCFFSNLRYHLQLTFLSPRGY